MTYVLKNIALAAKWKIDTSGARVEIESSVKIQQQMKFDVFFIAQFLPEIILEFTWNSFRGFTAHKHTHTLIILQPLCISLNGPYSITIELFYILSSVPSSLVSNINLSTRIQPKSFLSHLRLGKFAISVCFQFLSLLYCLVAYLLCTRDEGSYLMWYLLYLLLLHTYSCEQVTFK